ncbi:hypothetical protein PRUPE_6G148700 [Prunus persica]|uniref:Uncharacterized protein n=1 Tax=Prunus persica TaxID=3760 RepID=M5W4G9_PRUPE|nr:hypothetical protein PRUPE_6G148700 [Prunus persica]
MQQRGILVSFEHIKHFIRSGIRLLIITIILQKVAQINSIMDPFCEIPIMQKQMQASLNKSNNATTSDDVRAKRDHGTIFTH